MTDRRSDAAPLAMTTAVVDDAESQLHDYLRQVANEQIRAIDWAREDAASRLLAILNEVNRTLQMFGRERPRLEQKVAGVVEFRSLPADAPTH